MRVFFVTDRRDAHAQRFSTSFEGAFGADYTRVEVTGRPAAPVFLVEGESYAGWEALRAVLGAQQSVLVSGPLDTVSANLVGGNYRHVGISWATDVMVSAAASPEALETLATTVAGLNLVVTDNYATENALIAMGANPRAICRIPWGPEQNSAPALSRADLGLPSGAPVVLYPRSIEAHYQPEVFLDALEILVGSHPAVVAVLVESGSGVDQFKERVKHKGLSSHILWQPVRPPQEFRGLIALADAVVVTTVTDGTSVTVMDAMAQGIPVVTSLTNGSSEWVMDGVTGWTFPVGDARALASALERVVSCGPQLRGLIASHARRLVAEKAGWGRSEGILITEIQRLFSS